MVLTKLIWVTVMVYMVAAKSELQKTPTLKVESGKVRGVVKPDRIRGYYHSYTGIPFATVTDRFQAATPVQPWKHIFEADNDSIRCSQVNSPPVYLVQPATDVVTQEDCLTLNVYTPVPQPGSSALKPVMVFIYGGSFLIGTTSSRAYGPEFLLRNDVIVVNINYRLEMFGFLCLGIPEAPGNIGFKDQVMALRWIQKNIQAFGGDPNNVTIFGESSGAESALMHVVSPMSQGLFHKVIAESGTSMDYSSIEFEPLEIASQIATQMGYSLKDPKELYNLFMNYTATELLSFRDPLVQTFTFGGCVEQEIEGVERFLPDLPYNLLVSGQYAKVPMILGHNSNEGDFLVSVFPPALLSSITIKDLMPPDLAFPTEQEANDTIAELEKLYLNNAPVSKDTVGQVSNFVGDSEITYAVQATVDVLIRTNNQPVYLYNFSYSGLRNFIKYQTGVEFSGATHADELFYIFKHSLDSVFELVESTMIQRMTTMWTNFAKYSDPTPQKTPLLPLKWQPVTEDNQNEFVIDTTFSTNPMWNTKGLQYWRELYANYRVGATSLSTETVTKHKNVLQKLNDAVIKPLLKPIKALFG